MKKSIISIIAGLMIVPVLAFGVFGSAPVNAADCNSNEINLQTGVDCGKAKSTPDCLFGSKCAFTDITTGALFLIGAVSVLMLIYGGIRYTISGGEAKAITDAKNTILYAIVGIVVALLAYAIVNWVLGVFIK